MIHNEVNARGEDVAVVNNGSGVHKPGTADVQDVSNPTDLSEKIAQYSDRVVLGAHKAQEKIVDLGHRVSQKAADAKESIAEFGSHAVSEAKYLGGEVGVQARSHPLLLLGVAVVAGALIARVGRG